MVGRVLGEEDIWLSVSSRWWLDHLVISFEWVRNIRGKKDIFGFFGFWKRSSVIIEWQINFSTIVVSNR